MFEQIDNKRLLQLTVLDHRIDGNEFAKSLAELTTSLLLVTTCLGILHECGRNLHILEQHFPSALGESRILSRNLIHQLAVYGFVDIVGS